MEVPENSVLLGSVRDYTPRLMFDVLHGRDRMETDPDVPLEPMMVDHLLLHIRLELLRILGEALEHLLRLLLARFEQRLQIIELVHIQKPGNRPWQNEEMEDAFRERVVHGDRRVRVLEAYRGRDFLRLGAYGVVAQGELPVGHLSLFCAELGGGSGGRGEMHPRALWRAVSSARARAPCEPT